MSGYDTMSLPHKGGAREVVLSSLAGRIYFFFFFFDLLLFALLALLNCAIVKIKAAISSKSFIISKPLWNVSTMYTSFLCFNYTTYIRGSQEVLHIF